MPVTLTPAHQTVHRVFDQRFRSDRCTHLDLGDLDELALPRAAPMVKCRQQSDTGMHTGDRVGGPLQIARWPVGIPRHR